VYLSEPIHLSPGPGRGSPIPIPIHSHSLTRTIPSDSPRTAHAVNLQQWKKGRLQAACGFHSARSPAPCPRPRAATYRDHGRDRVMPCGNGSSHSIYALGRWGSHRAGYHRRRRRRPSLQFQYLKHDSTIAEPSQPWMPKTTAMPGHTAREKTRHMKVHAEATAAPPCG
jgi:hypothetical protein